MTPRSDLVQALSALPHGPEFRFVDELVELDPGVSAHGKFRLQADTEMMRGHFPGAPMLPGVIMVEALAQLGGVLLQTRSNAASLEDIRLTAIQRFKIRRSAAPGEEIHLFARLDQVVGSLAQVSGEVCTSAGEVMGSGTVILAGR
jgi:3-hydroxyacyl-[acyl-carrier-protein] dehydratase